jgi:hypothetical protein
MGVGLNPALDLLDSSPRGLGTDLPDAGKTPVNLPTLMGVAGFCNEKDPRLGDTKESIQRNVTICKVFLEQPDNS